MKFEAPRGTHDILPSEQPRWRQVKEEFERLCALYGYRRIDTPVFEDTELFARTSGEGSDIVTKEMYTFTDRGDRSLTLRPEATAPIVRAYLEHGLHREPQPQKLYTIETHLPLRPTAEGPLPRVLAARRRVDRLRRPGLRRRGDPAVRRAARPARDHRVPARAELDRRRRSAGPRTSSACGRGSPSTPATSTRRTREQAARNPLRALDNIAAKPPAVQEVLRQAPAIGDSLCDACREHFAEVRRYLDAFGVRYELVPTLVRGLDYYTRTTWEFVGPEGGSQSTLSGGGRYDGLAEALGGQHTPGVGFGAGIERLLIALEHAGTPVPEDEGIDVFYVCAEGADRAAVLAKVAELRADGRAGRRRLRRPLGQGPAHAGRPARREGGRRRRGGTTAL